MSSGFYSTPGSFFILMGLINTKVFIPLFVHGLKFVLFLASSLSTGSVQSGYSRYYELWRLLTLQTSQLLLSSRISPPWSARTVKVLKQLFDNLLLRHHCKKFYVESDQFSLSKIKRFTLCAWRFYNHHWAFWRQNSDYCQPCAAL